MAGGRVDEPDSLLPEDVDEPKRSRIDERSAAEKSFISSELEVSKVAQADSAGVMASRYSSFIRLTHQLHHFHHLVLEVVYYVP